MPLRLVVSLVRGLLAGSCSGNNPQRAPQPGVGRRLGRLAAWKPLCVQVQAGGHAVARQVRGVNVLQHSAQAVLHSLAACAPVELKVSYCTCHAGQDLLKRLCGSLLGAAASGHPSFQGI